MSFIELSPMRVVLNHPGVRGIQSKDETAPGAR
jgi:hypothetical protein